MQGRWDFVAVTDALLDVLIFSGLIWIILRVWISIWHMVFS